MVKFKDFSKPMSVFQVPLKANLVFKDFSRQVCIFKQFQACANPESAERRDYLEFLHVASLAMILCRQ